MPGVSFPFRRAHLGVSFKGYWSLWCWCVDGKRSFRRWGLGGQWFYRSERSEGWSEVAHVLLDRIWGWSKVFQIYSIGTSFSDSSVACPGWGQDGCGIYSCYDTRTGSPFFYYSLAAIVFWLSSHIYCLNHVLFKCLLIHHMVNIFLFVNKLASPSSLMNTYLQRKHFFAYLVLPFVITSITFYDIPWSVCIVG